MEVVLLPIADIQIGQRLRRVDEDWAKALLASMRERAGKEPLYLGQEHPVEVAKVEGGYALIDGAHRLAALKSGGSFMAWAIVKEMAPNQRRLWEIDAQLFRVELTAFFRAGFLHARKALYEEMHPETRRGVAGGKARQNSATGIVSFADDTAEKVGLGADTVSRLTMMYDRLSPASRDAIPGSPIEDSRKDLDLLSRQGPALQAKVMKTIAVGRAESVADALAIIEGKAEQTDPASRAAQRLLDGWTRAPAAARRQFLQAIPDDELRGAAAARGFLMVESGKRKGS